MGICLVVAVVAQDGKIRDSSVANEIGTSDTVDYFVAASKEDMDTAVKTLVDSASAVTKRYPLEKSCYSKRTR